MSLVTLTNVSTNNLKSVDVFFNNGEFIVFTGISGSGKSSLAFDTIFVEGQRRYISSLSSYIRKYFKDFNKSNVEEICGLTPVLAIEQKSISKHIRSTVGTVTELYDYLRVLYAEAATFFCPVSKKPVFAQSKEKILASVLQLQFSEKVALFYPLVQGKKGEFKEEIQHLIRMGFSTLRINNCLVSLFEQPQFDKDTVYYIDVLVDTFFISPENKIRITENVLLSLEYGCGTLFISRENNPDIVFSREAYSEEADLYYQAPESQDFSFNNPKSMCSFCFGLGEKIIFEETRVINPNKSIAEDCCSVAKSFKTFFYKNLYTSLGKIFSFDIYAPWKTLAKTHQDIFLYGTGIKKLKVEFRTERSSWHEFMSWKGVLNEAAARYDSAKSSMYKKKYSRLLTKQVCPSCHGSRLKPHPSFARFYDKTIAELTQMTMNDLITFFKKIQKHNKEVFIQDLIKDIIIKAETLCKLGLSYLTCDRPSTTLSGGEGQRVRLASQIGSRLVGVTYIFDEPSIGLHPKDNANLIKVLQQLRNEGNTVLVVEHDEDTMLACDRIIDIGPGAGSEGGQITFNGTVKEFLKTSSLTARYLTKDLRIPERQKNNKESVHKLVLHHASVHNLKNISVEVPLGKMIVVTGVSGSGKSSLIMDTLLPLLSQDEEVSSTHLGILEGKDYVNKVINIDQTSVGKNPRSNPATYLKFFDAIRELFAKTPQSLFYGYTQSHFSFNTSAGSCSECEGRGFLKIHTEYEEYEIECETCSSQRFDEAILRVKFQNKNIHDVLNMTIKEATNFFIAYPSIHKPLVLLSDIGLHYLTLGIPVSSLSGGEAQRIKLVKELTKPSSKHTVYILDEPSTGLHFHDIKALVDILDRLVRIGHTVIIIEHNMDIAKTADLIIDLGPKGGLDGGKIIGYGSPEYIAEQKSDTGKALAQAISDLPKKIPVQKKSDILRNESLIIENAHHHNLKNLSLSLPKNKITVCTGVAGSGKSSLAFDTIFAEGQIRFLNSLSSYVKSLIPQPEKPKVNKISGISPTISVERKVASNNPRSTVGTITETYDYLKTIFSYQGQAFCPNTGEAIVKITKQYVLEKIYELYLEQTITVLAPLEKKHNANDKTIQQLKSQGFLKIKFNNTFYDLDNSIPWYLCPDQFFVVVDHFKLQNSSSERFSSDIDRAVLLSKNQVTIDSAIQTHFFNLNFCVESTGLCFPDITPRTFSFNAKEGMCPECSGLGYEYGANLELLLRAFPNTPIDKICSSLTEEKSVEEFSLLFRELSLNPKHTPETLSEDEANIFLHGSTKVLYHKKHPYVWEGISRIIKKTFQENLISSKKDLHTSLKKYICSSCRGKRLNKLARNVKIHTVSICDICDMPISEIEKYLRLPDASHSFFSVLQSAYKQFFYRLNFLINIGLSYISLSRNSESLSHGEMQKIHFSKQLGTQLSGITYVIDEPTTGVHPRDIQALTSSLLYLKSLNNTLILVENNLSFVTKIADHIIDLGPLSGKQGGAILAQGVPEDIMSRETSLTGQYLSKKKIFETRSLANVSLNPLLQIKKAHSHNIKELDINIPLQASVVIAGVSGSGKTSLIKNIIEPYARQWVTQTSCPFKKIVVTNQEPLHTSSRSDLGTFLALSPKIREFFSELASSRALGLKSGHFSYNSPLGQCSECLGIGSKVIDISFLPPVSVICEQCHGNRLNSLSLTVKYRNYHFGDILKLSINELKTLFRALPNISPIFTILEQLRLDYLSLGRKLSELSAGEVQRLKLAKGLINKNKEPTLYLLDEPSTGQHIDDINYLQKIISSLVQEGQSVIFCEHNLNLIANADIVIEMGPESGHKGGEIIYQGSPKTIGTSPSSLLKDYMN